ncbi:hypothetical protein ABZT08_04495 [Streptomyces sp. NPDC005526]|uniref:hypothetical protein n=1 Tax=Streptomyces sp. NPDC005526 TaxID=3156885 RepID=UPI0033AB575E
MTARTSDKPVIPDSETGWATARRLRKRSVRTCLPAVEERARQEDRNRPEWNIVRGED